MPITTEETDGNGKDIKAVAKGSRGISDFSPKRSAFTKL
jgi:hypothetical protein